jgi:hypothetical protein
MSAPVVDEETAPPTNLQPGFLSDDPRDWASQRPAASADKQGGKPKARGIFVPLAEGDDGTISAALPSVIHDPLEAAGKLLARAPVHPSEVTGEMGAEGLTAATAAVPSTRFAIPTREAVAAVNAADEAATKAFGPSGTPSGIPERWKDIKAAPPAEREAIVAAGARQGVSVPDFIASDSLIKKRVAGGLKDTPVIGDPVARATHDMAESLGRRATEIAEGMAPASNAEAAGSSARTAIGEWITTGSSREMAQGYDALDKVIKGDTLVPLQNTRRVAAEITAKDIESATSDGQRVISVVREALLRPPGLTYDGLKELRTRIGNRLSGDTVEQGTSAKLLDRLYGALSDDLRFGVQRAGMARKGSSGRAALEAFDKATAAAREIFRQRADLADIVGVKGDARPAQVFERIMTLAGSGSGADTARLLLAKRAMGEEAWRDVGAAAIARMGLDKNAQFSPARFTTDYGLKRLSESGKVALFGRETKEALDDIARLSQAWEQGARYGNPSGTARGIAVTAGLASFWTHPLLLFAELGSGLVLAHVLARPAGARSAERYMRAYTQHARHPSPATKAIVLQTARTLAGALAEQSQEDPRELAEKLMPRRVSDQAYDVAPPAAERQTGGVSRAPEQSAAAQGGTAQPDRESDKVEDRRPDPAYAGISDDELLDYYNTRASRDEQRAIVREFARRGLLQLTEPEEAARGRGPSPQRPPRGG